MVPLVNLQLAGGALVMPTADADGSQYAGRSVGIVIRVARRCTQIEVEPTHSSSSSGDASSTRARQSNIRADRHGPHLLHSAAAGRWDVLGARFSRKALSRALASSSLTAIAGIRLSLKSPVPGSTPPIGGNARPIANFVR